MIDCVIISHFHLDHCGSLPYLTEMCGYDGPIYMTHPTREICPLLLEDYRKITVDQKGELNFFSTEDIINCMRKVIPISLHESVNVLEDLEIKCYYAGHVLGAAMFLIRSGDESVVYTGDYNTTPDRHLGAAWIDKVYPDVLITETTYATTIRDSKKARESDFLQKVHDCVKSGGKVLIPVFALGRAQELCILIESYWERMNLKVPVYFSGGITRKANDLYRLYINWTNEKLKKTFSERNMFDFKHIKPFEMAFADNPGPQVLFASPGMLHAGISLEVFKKWAPDQNNLVILPGYCVPKTVGARVLAGEKKIKLTGGEIAVNLKVKHLSFSAHADAKGIRQIIKQSGAKNVLLVHGELAKMIALKESIRKEFGIDSFHPANGETVTFQKEPLIQIDVSKSSIQHCKTFNRKDALSLDSIKPRNTQDVVGELDMSNPKRPRLVATKEGGIRFKTSMRIVSVMGKASLLLNSSDKLMSNLYQVLQNSMKSRLVRYYSDADAVEVGTILITQSRDQLNMLNLNWEMSEFDVAEEIINLIKTFS